MIDKPFPLRQKGIFQSWENGERGLLIISRAVRVFSFLNFSFYFSLNVPVQGILPNLLKKKFEFDRHFNDKVRPAKMLKKPIKVSRGILIPTK